MGFLFATFDTFQAVIMRVSSMRNEIASRQVSVTEDPHLMVGHVPDLRYYYNAKFFFGGGGSLIFVFFDSE